MTSIRHLLAASAVLAGLSACGGGGGSSPAPTVSAVAITSGNQTTVARAAVDGGLALTQSEGQDTTDRTTAQSLRAASPSTHAGAIDAALQRGVDAIFAERRTAASASSSTTPRLLVASSDTANCAAGGTVTTTFDDRDNNLTFSGGDTISIAFAQCKDSAADQIDGTMVFTISSVASATLSDIDFSGSVAFQGLSVVLGQTSAGINGSVSVTFVKTSKLLQVALTVGAGGLGVSASAPGYSDSIVYESGMQIATSVTLALPSTSTVSLNGSFTTSSLNGRVSVSTVQPVSELSTDLYPYAGQIIVTGAAGCRLRITVIDATQVQLELDANGDGIYEASTTVPWGALLG